ncbi:hypothetical protein L3Y34_005020 [Caenorhabditis briggsae]|uniref:Uncharacterized protein n=1 Tax=Caenorhabditis briggsae TaxID=6238 RepID=A0AAE9D5L7_CAEBR|nr:hypothetical protein L3Y34_005020 [Caenorhabditis briggsae]
MKTSIFFCNLGIFFLLIENVFGAAGGGYHEPSIQTIEKCHNQVKEKEKCTCHKKDPFCNRSFAMSHWNSIFKCISAVQKTMKNVDVEKKKDEKEEEKEEEEEE